jgi:hypothetical protein
MERQSPILARRLRFIVEELKAAIDRKFATPPWAGRLAIPLSFLAGRPR